MAKQRHTEGAFVSIPLLNGIFGFGRLLKNDNIGILDFFSKEESVIDILVSKPILFEVAVFSNVIGNGKWQKIGKRPLNSNYILKNKFIQDAINPKEFRLYNPNNGEMTDVTRQECINLNMATVYEGESIQNVLWDYYVTGKLTKWEELNKIEN